MRLKYTSKGGSVEKRHVYDITKTLERISNRKETFVYNGKKTRYAQRVEWLLEKQRVADHLRWMPQSMPVVLRKEVWRLTFKKRKA